MDDSSILDEVLMNDSLSLSDATKASVSYNTCNRAGMDNIGWCENCNKSAQDMQSRHKRHLDMVKQKLLFTDNLIQMYAKCKSKLDDAMMKVTSLEQQCEKKETDNQLIQQQLEALLANKNTSEVENLQKRISTLQQSNESLQDKVSGMEMTRQMYEHKIQSMKEEESVKRDTKKQHNHDMNALEKELKQTRKKLENIEKENEKLQKKLEIAAAGRRLRRNTGSHTTDSERPSTADSKVDGSTTNDSETTPFKEPVKRKKSKKVHRRKSATTEESDDDKKSPEQSVKKFARIKSFASDDQISSSSHVEQNVGKNKFQSDPVPLEEPISNIQADVVSSTSVTDEKKQDVAPPAPEPEQPPKFVVSSLMKERILESKVNRAYKTFIQRPTTTQRRELNLIAEGSSKLPVAEQITNFCKKHLLMGKENFVAKKILKSRTDILKPEVYSALIMIVKGVETTSQSEMSSDEKGKLTNQKKTETGKIQTLEKPQTAPETKEKSINDKKPSVPRARVVQAPAIQTEEKVIAKITSTSVKRHILPEKTAVSLKSKAVQHLKEEVLPEKSIEMDSAPDVKKSSNIQKETAIDYDHVVNMFSSDDDDLKEKKSQVDVTSKNVEHILVVPDVKEEQLINVPEIKDVRKIRTRSVSKSCSETSDTCSVKAKKVVKTKSLTETTPISPDVKSIPRSMKKLKEKRRRSSDVFSSLNQEPKPKLMKQNFVKESVPETEKVSDLFKITNDKIKSKEKKEKNKLKKSFPRVHPALISRESLPFTVGSNSPLPHIPPTPASPDFSFAPFVPDVEDVMEEGLDQEEVFPSDMSEDAKLQIILKEMEFPLPVQLSPLSLNKRMSMEKDEFDFPALLDDVEMTKDEDLDVEEESRISISPSADLCTALNFGSQSTQKASKQKKASKKSKTKQETKVTGTVNMNPVVSLQRVDLRDTPRRFSCEAPVRARAVPTIKPVVKNPPSDPSIISNQPAVGAQTVSWRPDSSFKAFNPKDTSLVSKEKTTTSESDKKTSFNSPQNLSKGQAISKVKENPHSSGNLPKTPSVEEKDDHFAPDVSMSSENFEDDNESETPLTLLDKLQASSSSKDPTLKTTPLKAIRESSQDMDGIFKQLQCYATNSSNNFNNLPCSTVVSWVATVAMHTFSFDLNKALEAKANTKDPTCYMHPVEAEFVQRVLVMERVRTKTRKGLIKSTVLPVLMRIICRYGQSLYSVKTLFSKTPVFDILSPILINSELPMPYLQSVIRIFCSMSRGLGCGRYVMEICRYGIISRSSNDVSTIIATAIICWPSLFTQHYPLSGKIVVSSLLHRILSTQLNTTKKENQLKLFTSLLNLLGWPNTPDVKMLEKNCIECLNACFDRIKAAKLVKSESVSKLEVENIDDVYIALQILVAMKGIDFLEKNIIMEVFWPLLHQWSHHLVMNLNEEANKEVSDACMIGVLRGLSACFLVLITTQKVKHPDQNILNAAVTHFDTLCALLQNFTTNYKNTAPVTIQCATAATVLSLSFCNAESAYMAIYSWLMATKSSNTGESRSGPHPYQAQLTEFYHEGSLRKIVSWLEGQRKTFKDKKVKKSLTPVIWG